MTKYIAKLNYGDRLNTGFRGKMFQFNKGDEVEVTQEEKDKLAEHIMTVSGRPFGFKTSFQVSKFIFEPIKGSINTETPKKEENPNPSDSTMNKEDPKPKAKKKKKKKSKNEAKDNEQSNGKPSKPEEA